MTEVCCNQEIDEKGKITWLLQSSDVRCQKDSTSWDSQGPTSWACLWMTMHPSGVSTSPLSFVSSANLLKVHLITSSMPLMKAVNNTSPNTDLWKSPLTTNVHQDSEPLCSSGCDHSTILIRLTVPSSNLSLCNLESRMFWGELCQRLYRISDKWHL